MCSPASCQQCGKTTWSGCGMHVDQVFARVPAADRCTCAAAPSQPAQWYPRSSTTHAR